MAQGPVLITAHAIDRFQERVRPTLLRDRAEDELRNLTNRGELRATVEWHEGYDAYLLLADGIALGLKHNGGGSYPWTAVTVLVRAGLSPQQAERRRERRRKRRHWRSLSGEHKRGRQTRKQKLTLREEQVWDM